MIALMTDRAGYAYLAAAGEGVPASTEQVLPRVVSVGGLAELGKGVAGCSWIGGHQLCQLPLKISDNYRRQKRSGHRSPHGAADNCG